MIMKVINKENHTGNIFSSSTIFSKPINYKDLQSSEGKYLSCLEPNFLYAVTLSIKCEIRLQIF